MNDLQAIEQMQKGAKVAFFLNPKDKVPTVITTVEEIETEFNGKTFIKSKGINDWLPFYHFKPCWLTITFGSTTITQPLDDLHKRLGI